MYRAALLLILAATLRAPSWAQLNRTELTTKVEKATFGPEGAWNVKFHIQNNSNKTIAAVSIELTLKAADGSIYKIDSIHDYGSPSYDPKMPKQQPAITPGKGFDAEQIINPDETLVSAKLEAVIYTDRTAHGDNDAIDGMVSSRQHRAEEIAKQYPEKPDYVKRSLTYAVDDLRRQP